MPDTTLNFPPINPVNFGTTGNAHLIYWLLLLFVFATFLSLPLLKVDISVHSPGIIRPSSERTVIRSFESGIIHQVYFREGQFVNKGEIIAQLTDNITKPKLLNLDYEIGFKKNFIKDLEILNNPTTRPGSVKAKLMTPLYGRQLDRYLYGASELSASIRKIKKELKVDSSLYRDKIISGKEFYDKNIELEKSTAAYEAFVSEQLSSWQQDLSTMRAEVSRLLSEREIVLQEQTRYAIAAPASGILQGLTSRYQGGYVGAGEEICELSPETELIAECLVPTQDVGMLHSGQVVQLQVDAFNYNHFGIIEGKILSIDNDFTKVNDIPVFKVRCSLDSKQLSLKNGFKVMLKKGLGVQARFIVARRTLAQLIFDQVDDWFNPATFKALP